MTSIKTKANISTILLVGLCLPAYYKTKLVLEDKVSWPEVFDFLALLETIYAFLLATLLVCFHRFIEQSAFKERVKSFPFTLFTWIIGAFIAFTFTHFYFMVTLGISTQASFQFDIVVLSLCLPLILSGISDRIFLEYQSQALALQVQTQKKEVLAAKFEVLKMRLSPHFLFNSLNTLADIIEQDPDLALRFVEHMATTYRYILAHKDKPVVPLSSEIQSVEALLFILKVRHAKALSIDIQIPASGLTPTTQELIAPLTLQELIENALKHNKYSAEQPLLIKIYRKQQSIVVENTIRKRLNNSSHQSGLENLQERIKHAFVRPMVIEEDSHVFRVSIPLQLSPFTVD